MGPNESFPTRRGCERSRGVRLTGREHPLDADGEPLRLGRPLSDEVGAAAVGFQQVVGLLALHVPGEPAER